MPDELVPRKDVRWPESRAAALATANLPSCLSDGHAPACACEVTGRIVPKVSEK